GAGPLRPVARRLQRLGEAVEAVGPYSGENVVFVLEVAVGRHGRDAELGRQLPHGHRVGTALGEQLLRRLAEALAEIGDVGVGQDSGHRASSRKYGLLLATAYGIN